MKLKTEYFKTRDDGAIVVATKTTTNCMVQQVETGSLFDVAYDVGYFGSDNQYHATKHTYEATDIAIKTEEIGE